MIARDRPDKRIPVSCRQAFVALLMALCVAAAPADEHAGRFEIRTASAGVFDGVWYLNARIDYELNRTALAALADGVPLTLELQIEIRRERRWRPDKAVATLLQHYELRFHALSERYVVVNVNSGEQRSYPSLDAALRALGEIRNLPLLDATLLRATRSYELRLRAVLEVRSLPIPLRLLNVFFDDWRQQSEWYTWRLVQ